MTVLPMVETTSSYGTKNFVVLTTEPTSLTAITLAEANAGDEITCHLLPAGVLFPATQGTVTPTRHECQTVVADRLGLANYGVQEVAYSVNPQTLGTPGSAGNEAYEALPKDAERWIIARYGVANGVAKAAGQAYTVYHIKTGEQRLSESDTGEAGEYVVNQAWELIGASAGKTDGVFAA